MASFTTPLTEIKSDLLQALPDELIDRTVAALGVTHRHRCLTPAVTTRLALTRALYQGTALTHLPHLAGLVVTPSAYCQAIDRLPLDFFAQLCQHTARHFDDDRVGDRWRGHRLFLIDGTSVSMPDTPALQEAFGQPSGQAPGCGFPVAHLLALFTAGGALRRTILAPLRTHDLAHVTATHPELQPGDILLGDRAFGSFAHLALLRRQGCHGLFRLHQRRPVGAVADRLVTYVKPATRPVWLSEAAYAALPDTLTVREVRVRVRTPGRRVTQVVLVTTLLDRRRYPRRALARLYERRWQVEVDLRSLKQTLGMDILRSRTPDGVRKEVLLFGLAYNLVRRVVRAAAARQRVSPRRVSFVDALRWLQAAVQVAVGADPVLVVNPARPGRFEPRVRKRRPKQYPLMTRPRAVLKEELLREQLVA